VSRFLVLVLLVAPFARAQEVSVRSERGRFWIDCQSAPLEEVLRKVAADSPMELWLDEGLSEKRVSARVDGATLKQVLEEVFEKVKDVNYVLTFDASNPERVTKIHGGAWRPVASPGAASNRKSLENSPFRADPKRFAPEAQEALGALREFVEQQQNAPQNDGQSDSSDAAPPEALALDELLKNLPQFRSDQSAPRPAPVPANPVKKEKPKGSQL
jgi:type II secretory pathway component GspD/PulD (secretin)